MLCEVLRILHPLAHSLILIWGNKKLRQAFLSFLWQLSAMCSRKFCQWLYSLVNCIDWVKKHKISCADEFSLLWRISLLWIIVFHWYGTVLHPSIYSSEVKTIVHITWVVSNHFSLWLTTSLSVLYLLKIANFSSLLFLHLKWRAERVVLMILWGSLVFLVFHLAVVSTDEIMKMNVYKGNITWESKLRDIAHLSNVIIFTLANFIPFTMSLTAVLLLIFSMWKHLKKMHLSGKGSQDPSTEVHLRAMQTVISFLLLFVIYFFAQIISIWNFNIMQNNSVLWICQVLGILYPSSHSFILIWGNKKLRQAFLSFLRQLSLRHNIRNILIPMSFEMKATFLVVSTGMIILGVLGNGFIGLVNCIEWFRTGKVSSADFILTSLALARIIQLLVILLDSFIMGLAPHVYAIGKLTKVVTILWALNNHLSIWFATCLSVFYFLKIANFSHSFFMWLKWRVNRVLLLLFLGSFFLLSLNLLMQDSISELWLNSYRVHEINMTLQFEENEMSYLKSFLLLLTLTYIIPFLLTLISLLLLFLSLLRHSKNFQLNLTGSGDSSTEAHRRAMKMVTMFLLLFIIYIISLLTASWIFTNLQTYQVMMLVIVISTAFPSGHSFIIILGNSKLRQIALRTSGPVHEIRAQDMINLLPSILSILIIVQCVLGSSANGFIGLVNCIDWVKKHKISCADGILTALAVSRIKVKTIVHITWVVSNHFSLWLATSLSILYLLKIANSSSLLFLHLKWRAKRVVLMILRGTLLFFIVHLAVVSTDAKMRMNEYKGNITWESKLRDITQLSNVIIFTLANFILFTISLTAVLLLIFSMWKHLKKMHLSGKGSQDPSTEVHIRAMQSVISFLLLFVIFFVAQIISVWNLSTQQNNSLQMLCKVLGTVFSVKPLIYPDLGEHNIRNILIPMSFEMKATFLVVSTGMIILGVLGNGFIGLVNCIEWSRTGKVSSADFILTSLALARIIQLLVILLDSFIMGLASHLYATGKLAKVVTILWALTNHLTIWLATCLSVFYFLKIANFSHSFFMWLKWRVNRVLLLLFLWSFFLLSLNLLMHDATSEFWLNTYRVHKINMTLQFEANEMLYLKSLLLLSFTYIIPFFLSLISLLLLFLSLVRHIKNFQLNLTGSGDSSTEAHRRAMKMVTMFLLLFIIYIISIVTACWIFTNLQTYEFMMLVIMISTAFPSGHSFIIILGNSKLRQIALRSLWHLHSLRKAKPLPL
ncbi:LOW QUALITY PROTEIN: hypothetical protein QTO34_017790 [Cnephaeus nilssonii]|uniref:G-protein coupled receptors family 1 profile domain-containing protein n=1 Tax=Cnephaeus nilssonii TaxID=3371016 RepID=A0AA40LRW0_CNENI|nr:LOW QUALITY PROTEIN: hypothetical protein QTO34_017790 [Eptesicus nilssonii]